MLEMAPRGPRRTRKMMDDLAKKRLTSSTVTFNNGNTMPKIGLGTYKIRQSRAMELALDTALEGGYRLFDTAAVYNNEVALGEMLCRLLKKHGLDRDDIFITTKLAPNDLGDYDVVNAAYERSLANLGITQADLFLIHYPGSSRISSHDGRNSILRRKAWEALSRIYNEGRVSAIGVANFTVTHLNDLGLKANEVVPVVNQVEWHPYYHQEELMDYCRSHDICLQAYSSFGGASSGDIALFEDPVVKRIAEKYGAGPNHVLLSWALQQDVAVIPKSINPEHIMDNISINFELTKHELKELNTLRSKGKKYAWDPTEVR